MAFTRRRFLGSAAAASLLPLAPAYARQHAGDLDVAIIGGGVSGVYAAWRLRQARPELHVRLFEMSDRIGGRLRSVAFPQAPQLVGEVGGMRFLDDQRHVAPLVRQLGLARRFYPLFGKNNRLALRGKTFPYSEAGTPGHLYPYNIPDTEQSQDSTAYMDGIARIVPDAKTMTPEKWRKIRATLLYKGRPLKDWSAWTMLSEVFTHEELAFQQDSAGYDDVALHESGLDQFDFVFTGIDFNKPFYTVVGGYQKLPTTLAEEAKRAGAGISMQTRLASVAIAPDGLFHLALVTADGRRAAITARQVVLALPRRSLELIDDFPARREPHFADMISSVDPIPACKALLLYPKPWWRDLGITGGRSVTDMQARQFYPLGAETERTSAEPTNGHGVLMMYSDANTVEYWKEAAPPAQREAYGFQWLAGGSQLAQEVHREAKLVYGSDAPQPLAACFQDWTAEPYGGGWHFWRIGTDSAVMADRVQKPFADRDLYICGEAYGVYEPGWVEGALERAETMLQRHFGLPAPKWLT
ncbi:MAG: FAD-dependent oxidoreductase [Alphaproteobacteria bacterium]|nr:FAD-dependent oxidoreductase [Alphaproteobacteria bacterium]